MQRPVSRNESSSTPLVFNPLSFLFCSQACVVPNNSRDAVVLASSVIRDDPGGGVVSNNAPPPTTSPVYFLCISSLLISFVYKRVGGACSRSLPIVS